MKITASRKDDILRRQAEYEEEMKRYTEDRDSRDRAYRAAEDAVLDPIRDALVAALAKFSLLEFDVRVQFNFESAVDVDIQCNEHTKFEENSALSWSYRAKLLKETGEVKKETSSWSGMKATTAAQINSLKQSVAALEYLLSVDWAELLNVTKPSYRDFYEGALRMPPREDFKSQLAEAELAELVGTNTLIKVKNWEDTSRWGRSERYIQIDRETPAQWVLHYIPARVVDEGMKQGESLTNILNDSGWGFKYTTRVSKSKIIPVEPFATLEY